MSRLSTISKQLSKDQREQNTYYQRAPGNIYIEQHTNSAYRHSVLLRLLPIDKCNT